MSRINSFEDSFKSCSGASRTTNGANCEHPQCQGGTGLPIQPVPLTRTSPFCHEQGQKIDNSSAVIGKIAELCTSQELTDLQIIVAGKRYYTHKLLLCCSSDVFRVMLTNQAWTDAHRGEITLVEENECVGVFDDFLRYLYSGCVHLTHYNVLPVLMLADKYNVTHLRAVCIEYMCNHIVSTKSHNHAVSWLQYAYTCGHWSLAEVCHHFILWNFHKAEVCHHFILWNFHKVMSTTDFLLMQKDVLIDFLQDSDLVIPDEFTLFKGVVHWLENHQKNLSIEESWNKVALDLLSLIRFPMMSLTHLCQLEQEALTDEFNMFFVDKIGRAIQYHSAFQADKEHVKNRSETENHQREPRIYTNDTWSTSLVINDFSSVAENEVQPLLFSTPVSGSEADENKSWGWNVDFYPKGIQFQKCIMIGLWRNLEISGLSYKTVRLKLETQQAESRRVQVCVLVVGVQDSVEHVKNVIVRQCLFDHTKRVHVINDVVPYEDLNCSGSDYLIGSNGVTFKISIIIKPM